MGRLKKRERGPFSQKKGLISLAEREEDKDKRDRT